MGLNVAELVCIQAVFFTMIPMSVVKVLSCEQAGLVPASGSHVKALKLAVGDMHADGGSDHR